MTMRRLTEQGTLQGSDKKMTTSSLLTSILLFALFTIVPEPLRPQELSAEDESEIAKHMHEYLNRITTIKSFIIMGNLDSVRERATWLVDHEVVSGLPANSEHYIELIRGYAREIVEAPDLETAAKSVSSMARTCGNCHLVNHVDLEFGYDQMPADWADIITHMQRHQWAVGRLWEGLIGPSDVAWNQGADMLVDVALDPIDLTYGATSDAEATQLDKNARRIHSLGDRGIDARTPDARSEMYGEILGLCADCHIRLDRGPGR